MATTLAMILPLAANMESLLQNIEIDVLTSKLGAVTNVGISLAAACVAFSLIQIGSQYLRGMQFNWMTIVRPLLIFFIICNFSTIVLNPLRSIAGVYNTHLAENVGSSVDSFKAMFKEKAEQMCHEEFGLDEDTLQEIQEQDNWFVRTFKKVGNKLLSAYFNLNEKLNYGAAEIMSGILFFFLNIFTSVMIIIANLYLIVMALIGPFTFAISILPSYSNGIKLWIERYIQYTLWQPLLYIILYLGTEIMIQGNQAVDFGGFWAWTFMVLAIFTMIKQVPGIASFIIESAGTEALANQLSGIAGQTLQKASSASMIFK